MQRQHQGRGYLQLLFETFIDFSRAEGYKAIPADDTGTEACKYHPHIAKHGEYSAKSKAANGHTAR